MIFYDGIRLVNNEVVLGNTYLPSTILKTATYTILNLVSPPFLVGEIQENIKTRFKSPESKRMGPGKDL